MKHLRNLALVGLCLGVPFTEAGEQGQATDNT
jgi:hypothetical protein